MSTLRLHEQQAADMDPLVEVLERKIGYTLQDKDIANQAHLLAGNGVLRIGKRDVPNGNKRLVVLGDNVIDMVLYFEWYGSGREKGESNELLIWFKIGADRVPNCLA